MKREPKRAQHTDVLTKGKRSRVMAAVLGKSRKPVHTCPHFSAAINVASNPFSQEPALCLPA
jgi:hypothetical protein